MRRSSGEVIIEPVISLRVCGCMTCSISRSQAINEDVKCCRGQSVTHCALGGGGGGGGREDLRRLY
jgi:hypothetical protein